MSAGKSKKQGEGLSADYLFTRDVDPLDMPDRIYALGGGGMQMVLEMFRQEWFVIETLRARDREVQVYLMDTATDHDVESDVKKLQEQVDELEQELRSKTESNFGSSINFNYINITRSYSIQNFADLAGEGEKERILNNTYADYWWVRREHLTAKRGTGLYDIGVGVIKRRSIGKAMHWKALSTESSYDDIFSGLSGQRVAIFAGLGGGTGSGTLIDVAERISDREEATEVTVFATLPSTREHENSKANTYAALCELEYLHLKENLDRNEKINPIDAVVLFPLEPTQNSQATTKTADLKEFDRALSYAVCGFYNNPDHDYATKLNTAYTPFTLAVPQVIHYSQEETAKAKDRALETLRNKRELLNTEYRIWEDLQKFFDEHYPDIDGIGIDESEFNQTVRNHLEARFTDFERLIEFDLFELLEYEVATEEGVELLDDIYGDLDRGSYSIEEVLEERDVSDVIEVAILHAAGEDGAEGLVDDRNQLEENFLRTILYTDLYHFEDLYELLAKLQRVKQIDGDDIAANLLEYLLLPNVSDKQGRTRLKMIRQVREEQKKEIDNLEEELSKIDRSIEQARTEKEQRINRLTKEWYEDVENDIKKYKNLRRHDLNAVVKRLENELDNFAGHIANKDNPHDVDASDLKRALGEIEGIVASIDGIECPEIDAIRRDIKKLTKTREDWNEIVEAAENGGGWFGGSPDIKNERMDYNTTKRQLTHFSTSSAPPTPERAKEQVFNVSVEYDPREEGHVLSEIDDELIEIKENISVAFQRKLAEVESEGEADPNGSVASDGLTLNPETETAQMVDDTNEVDIVSTIEESDLGTLEADLKTAVRETVAEKVGDEVPELQQKKGELEKELTDARTARNRLEALETLYEHRKKSVTNYSDVHETYRENLRRGAKREPGAKGIKLTSHFVQNVDPKDTEKAIKKPSLNDADLLSDGGEKERIKRYLQRIVETRFLDTQYNGLDRRTLTDGSDNFDDAAVNVAVLGEVIDHDSDYSLGKSDFEFGDSVYDDHGLRDRFNISKDDKYEEWLVRNSHPWEVGACIYIQGISFLDNLYGVAHGRTSYPEQYKSQNAERTKDDMIVRHTYGLERGFYIRRLDLEPVRRDPGLFIQNSEQEIREELLDRHEKVWINEDEGPGKKIQ